MILNTRIWGIYRMDKYDLLKRKIAQQYDEDFTIEGIVPTEKEFNEMADNVRANSKFDYTDAEFISIRDQIRENRAASIGIVLSIDKPSDNHDMAWFTKYRENNPDKLKYNHRFELYMTEEKNWSDESIKELDRNTDEIINRLGDPNKKGAWKRKGLVIGDVQSGKTVNYTSVCNKAIDAGYKIIIILAGRTNTLRKQTQKRLEADMIGVRKDDTNQKKGEVLPTIPVGVGLYGDVSSYQVEAVTTNVTDFSKKVADISTLNINEYMMPRVFVVKKIKSVLDNLVKSLGGEPKRQINVPVLLIDDEADDASVNTKTADSPTAINSCIRRLLKIFTRSTYLAVTATPFANILIDPYVDGTSDIDTDLFPEDFICCLTTPDKYIGSEKLFRDEHNSGFVIPILEDDVKYAFPFKHKKTQEIAKMPDSLKDAIRYFAITNAVRDIIGHTKSHRSMMINVSRFVDVQNRLKNKVITFWNDEVMLYIKSFSKMGDKALEYKQIAEIKRIFDETGIGKDYSITWELVQSKLYESNEKVSILSVNQKSSDSLDYERFEIENKEGMRVIAIGGDCLSRGLTLEGLCVSYFYRNSQMYDTLMQMGRWFGYRPGYDKVIRIWMADKAIEWYSHISEATEALKIEVYRMNKSRLTPMEFGYRINGHPDSLIPTAKGKMRNARLVEGYADVDVSGQIIECPRLYDDLEKIKLNEDLTKDFIKNNSSNAKIDEKGNICIADIDSEIIADYIEGFKSKLWKFYYESSSLAEAIRNNKEKWNVFVINGKNESDFGLILDNGKTINIGAQKRTSIWRNGEIKVSGTKVRVGQGGCTAVGISNDISFSKVKEEWEALPPELCVKKDGSGFKEVPDDFILHGFVDKPMLLIHNLDIYDDKNNKYETEGKHVIALSLGFPSSEDYEEYKKQVRKPTKVRVYLNVIAQGIEDEEGDDVVDENL